MNNAISCSPRWPRRIRAATFYPKQLPDYPGCRKRFRANSSTMKRGQAIQRNLRVGGVLSHAN